MAEATKGESKHEILISCLTLAAAVPVAGLVAFGVSRALHHSYCTLNQQLRVWGAAFLVFLAVLVFALQMHRFGDRRAAAVRTVLAVALIALILSFWLPNLFGAISRFRQIGTKADLRTISEAVKSARSSSGEFPSVSSVAALNMLTARQLPERDRWGNPFVLRSEPARYVVISFGECGKPDQPDPWGYKPGPTYDVQSDIVFLNGKLWRYPEGVQSD